MCLKKENQILWSGNFVVEKNMPQNVSENGEEKILNPKTDDMSLMIRKYTKIIMIRYITKKTQEPQVF